MSILTITLALLMGLVAPAAAQADANDHAGHDHGDGSVRTFTWDDETLDLFRTVPVQEDGRVKPLDTQVSFLLLRMNGRRSVRVPDEERFGAVAGTKLSPMEWALDCLFFPEQAAHYPVFQVQTSDVIHAIGMDITGKKKRDRYSYSELQGAEERLLSLTQQYSGIEEVQRTLVQGQIVSLGFNYFHYQLFQDSLAFAGVRFPVSEPALIERLGGQAEVSLSDVLARGTELWTAVLDLRSAGAGSVSELQAAERQAIEFLTMLVSRAGYDGRFLAWIPPAPDADAWLTLPGLVDQTLLSPTEGVDLSRQVAAVASAERLYGTRLHPDEFREAALVFRDQLAELAQERGEYDKVGLEVALYQHDPFTKSLALYLLGFVLAAFGWFRPKSRWLWKVVGLATLAATLVLSAGIVTRCVLRGRPPVTTLYETVLFVTATVAIVAMVIEWIQRGRVAISVGALVGAAGLFLAFSYERLDGQDTMPTLVAVLDTNFWLATHVTTVTMGYAASLLAGVIAHVFLLGKLIGLRRGDKAFYKGLVRMVYGVVCFGLLFSIVGTILGGVWANDSWGRFWGWDPKENGALLIVLWNILILHTRKGGYIRDFGLCLLAVFGNIVVAFSWWGVNLLGVGLHSYGFTAGVQQVLNGFYAVQAGVVILGIVAYLMDRRDVPTAS